MPVTHISPLLANDVTPMASVNGLYRYQHPTYGPWLTRYVRFLDAVTYVAGHSCEQAVAGGGSVTNDRSGGSSLGNWVRGGGLALLVMTQNYYGYALVVGFYPTIFTSGADDIAVGESLILHASTDGACDGVVATGLTTASFGTADVADINADNTVSGWVDFL